MLGKLLKHEFRAVGRTMLPVVVVLIVLAGLANISIHYIENVRSDFVELVLGLFIAAFVFGIIVAVVMALVVMIERFYKNLLKDEGYLMMTLPVNVHALVWSKLIVSFVWFVITALVVYAVIGLTVANLASLDIAEMFRDMPSLRELLDSLYQSTGITGGRLAGFFAEIFVLIIVSCLCTCLHFYAAMSLGHCFANNKVLLSIVFFVAISFVFSLLTPLFGMEVDVTVTNNAVMIINQQALYMVRLIQKSMLYMLLYELFQGAVLYAATTLSLKKGLNLG